MWISLKDKGRKDMVNLQQRRYERHNFKTPITHSMYNNMDHRNHLAHGYFDNYHTGVMVNSSNGGIYFESETPCRVNSMIYINMVDHIQGLVMSKVTDALAARVVWCKKEMVDEKMVYKVGVNFIQTHA
jgi:hypothetical protein